MEKEKGIEESEAPNIKYGDHGKAAVTMYTGLCGGDEPQEDFAPIT